MSLRCADEIACTSDVGRRPGRPAPKRTKIALLAISMSETPRRTASQTRPGRVRARLVARFDLVRGDAPRPGGRRLRVASSRLRAGSRGRACGRCPAGRASRRGLPPAGRRRPAPEAARRRVLSVGRSGVRRTPHGAVRARRPRTRAPGPRHGPTERRTAVRARPGRQARHGGTRARADPCTMRGTPRRGADAQERRRPVEGRRPQERRSGRPGEHRGLRGAAGRPWGLRKASCGAGRRRSRRPRPPGPGRP
ncbi:hypothetical protein HD595_000472 [Nonomuraea roseoviolacea subsp. carminata]|uniref:Uncharacterized protein n=1 Tax=Nonomuraea roseoviolacea subsp. carminata TaxID=160689 RepID=A0ABT1JRY3_9ACTN|nr:hypothetical protein [Nonomuraea roseoviolacea subsp. carminata]